MQGGRVQDAAQTPADATATADAAADAFIDRAAEEARGHVRWLRPEFQNPDLAHEGEPEQARFASDDDAGETFGTERESPAELAIKAQPWPKTRSIRCAL